MEVAEDEVLEFPFGLIGLGGARYALLDRNPGSGFLWLHCVEDAALALPVVRRTRSSTTSRSRSRPRTGAHRRPRCRRGARAT